MKDTVKNRPQVLLELRPAFDGYAGIPQETPLLFRGLRMLESCNVSGMLQMSQRLLSKGTDASRLFGRKSYTPARRINRYSRVVVSAAEKPFATVLERASDAIERRLMSANLTVQTLLGTKDVKLTTFRPQFFEDFIWRTLFAKTLPVADFELVTGARQMICRTPWHTMHMVGLNTLTVCPTARYPRLRTK